MAEIKLSANSIAWGSGLNVSAQLTYDPSNYADMLPINLKLTMTLKREYALYATPPVYLRVYQGDSTTALVTVKNTTKISFNGNTTTTFTLYENSFTLARGHNYRIELAYTGTIDGKNIGINTQTTTLVLPPAVDPNFTVDLKTTLNSALRQYTCTATVTSKIAATVAPFDVEWSVLRNGVVVQTDAAVISSGSPVTSSITTAPYEYGDELRYQFICSVQQRGVVKEVSSDVHTVAAWQAPYNLRLTQSNLSQTSATFNIIADTDPRNTNNTYTYELYKDEVGSGAPVAIVVDTPLSEFTFNTLEAGTRYSLYAEIIDSLGKTNSATVSFTTPEAPFLRGTVVLNGQLQERVLYYCEAPYNIPRRIVKAAVVAGGVVKKIKQTL